MGGTAELGETTEASEAPTEAEKVYYRLILISEMGSSNQLLHPSEAV